MIKLIELEAAALAAEDALIAEKENQERTHCRQCGKEITDWDEVV